MANKQENTGGYMDNVRVKISEKYKPPPKIGLAMSYAQRLSLNKQIQDTIPKYEFVLEKTVIEKMKEWRNARSVMFKELSERLEKAKSKREEKSGEEDNSYLNSGPSQCYQQNHTLLMPTKAGAFSNILTPIPLKEQTLSQTVDFKSPEKSPFNISDFEADTSSPFDNMELKSINDLEELAQVLKQGHESKPNYVQSSTSLAYPMVTPSYPSYSIPNTTSFIQPQYANGYYYPETSQTSSFNTYSFNKDNSSPVENTKISSYANIPNIMKTLQNEINNTHLDNTKNGRKSELPKVKTRSEDLSEEFSSLPKSMQDMSKSISSMGFPLSRVARVCKVVGNDQKKVVEHLLAMSELLDLGFSESSVSTALLQCDNDRDKALDILIS